MACVRLALGCYVAPRLPHVPSPPWAVLIGPQSWGKSTILTAFNDIPYTVCVDDMTRNALTSCYVDDDDPDADHSLFHRLASTTHPEGEKVWITQELSTITSMDPILLEKHLSNIRAAHVGKHTTYGGIGGERTRKIGAFGMLLGTTEAFEPLRAKMSTFGDRFLCIRMVREAERVDEMLAESIRAWTCDTSVQSRLKDRIKAETHAVINRVIARLRTLKDSPVSCVGIPDSFVSRLSTWSTIHSTFATSHISNGSLATAAGKPYRIVEQVRSWGDAHALLDGRTEWNESEMDVARRIFQDSMPRAHWDLLLAIARGEGAGTTNMDLVRQWNYLGAVDTSDGAAVQWGRGQMYRLTNRYRQMAEEAGYFDG